MGVTSKLFRYRSKGKDPNVNNVEKFGQPAHSLFISSKFVSFTQKTEITDAEGKVVYKIRSRFGSIHDKTYIKDARTNEKVAEIERKVLTLREYHRVTMADGTEFDIAHELVQVLDDTAEITGLGWQLRGNYASLNFELYDGNGEIIAVIGKKFISLKDKYVVDIYRPELEQEVVAVLVALQHTLRNRGSSHRSSSLVVDLLKRV